MADQSENPLFTQIRQTRKTVGRARGDGSLHVDDADAFPLLMSLLATLPSGASKGAKNGRIAFFLNEGKLTACVTVPSMAAVAFYTLDGLSDAFCRLEGAMEAGSLEWREDKQKGR